MTTPKKKTTKKPVAPPPPKNLRMDIILDPQRQEVLKQLGEQTGEKTNTKILFYAAHYYLNVKPGKDKALQEAQEEIRVLKNELYAVKRSVSSFFEGLDDMRKAVTGKETPGASNGLRDLLPNNNQSHAHNDNEDRYYCPDCDDYCDEDQLDGDRCPNCDMILRNPDGYKIDYPTGDAVRHCPECGSLCYITLSDAYFCPECDKVQTEFDDE